MLHISVIRQSVYWTTGSFNYVYPLFMLFWYWYTLQKYSEDNFNGKKLIFTSILAFFSSATVEQGGMMAFGLTLLFFLYKFIHHKKKLEHVNLKRLLVILLFSFIGIASVICSPAQLIRFNLESNETFNSVDSIKKGFDFFINIFILKDYYRPQVILVLLSIFLSFITSKKFNSDEIFMLVTSFILRYRFSNNDVHITCVW